MKKVMMLLLNILLLFSCTACSGLLERDYTQISQHQEQRAETDDATALRAESYGDLISSAQYFVTMGARTGTVRLYQYSGDIDKALDRVCNTILTSDPLGSYALRDIKWEYTRIVSHYECVFTYYYRRTMDQIAAIQTISGKGGFRERTASALKAFSPNITLKSDSGYQSVEAVQREFWKVFYDTPQAALATPRLTVRMYPERGAARVIEMEIQWPFSQQELQKRAEAVSDVAARLTGENGGEDRTQAWLLYTRLRGCAVWKPDGSDSVYSVLAQGSGSSEGIAMAYQLLCDRAGIDCQTVRGSRKDQVHCWNLITVDGVSWHLDVTAGDGENHFLHTDAEMSGEYSWSKEDYPACIGTAEEGEPS